MDPHHEEPHAPGQFPEEPENDKKNAESWATFLTQNIPFFSSFSWYSSRPGGTRATTWRDGAVSASEGYQTDSDFPFIESEVEIETTPDEKHEVHQQAQEDYFSYPAHKAQRRKHWSNGTPLGHPFSRGHHRKSKHKLQECHHAKDTTSRDDTWNLISAADLPIASANNGAPEFHPSAPGSRELSKTLQELDEVEIKTFLQNFSRHTREVRLFGNTQHFSRMPQWSDFAYSSDEDEEKPEEDPVLISQVQQDPHKRSKLLMHIDRGLQQLQPGGLTNAVPGMVEEKVNKCTPYTGLLGDPNIPETTVKRSTMGEQSLEGRKEYNGELCGPLKGITDDLAGEPTVTTTSMHSPNEDTDAYESATYSNPDSIRRGRKFVPDPSEVPLKDDHVDGVAFCIAYILAFIEYYAPNDLDDSPITEYRESRARSHVERLYIIAPFWEQLLQSLRQLYCWDNPTRTAAAAMIYFVLWYTDLIITSLFLMLIYYVLQFRYMPPDESYLHQKVQQRMLRGMDANRLAERLKRSSRLDILDIYKRWQATYGVVSQVAAGDIADFHEKIKNILLWRNPTTSKRTVLLLSIATAFVTFCSAHTVFKTVMFGIGFTFFALLPLQAHYPRYRRPLNPLWWIVLGSPTDAQYAVQLLRERHQQQQQRLQREQFPIQENGATVPESDLPSSPLSPMTAHEVRREETTEKNLAKDKTPMSNKRLGSFLCQHHGVPGHLVVTHTHLYFSPLHIVHSGKHYVTRLDDVVGLRKTRSLRIWLWSSNGLKISRRNKRSLQFQNMSHRDDAFNVLLTFGSEHWRKV